MGKKKKEEKLFKVSVTLEVFLGIDTTDYGYHGVGKSETENRTYEYYVLTELEEEVIKKIKQHIEKIEGDSIFKAEYAYKLAKKTKKERVASYLWKEKWEDKKTSIKIVEISNLIQ